MMAHKIETIFCVGGDKKMTIHNFSNDCLLLIGEFASAMTFFRLLTVLDRTDVIPSAYKNIMPILTSDLLPFHPYSLRDGMNRMQGETRLQFFLETQEMMIIFLKELDELDLHFSLKNDDFADVNIWRLLDGIRLIHHPYIYSKVFLLRHYGINDVLSMLTSDEIRELLESTIIPMHLHNQLCTYEWTHRV
jgi:hypothetical protein